LKTSSKIWPLNGASALGYNSWTTTTTSTCIFWTKTRSV